MPPFFLNSGQVYDGFDGPRVIYEVGCDTVIYLNSDSRKTGRYEFYIQHMDGFVFDVTQRSVAAKVVESTKPIKTIVKYEMYFILGLISTASLPALILVAASDIAYSSVMMNEKAIAAKNLGADILAEHNTMVEYAPTLSKKLEECFVSQAKVKWGSFSKQLPKTIVKDEKTQGQLAGVLAGKAVLSPKAFTVWTAVFTILTSAAIKAVTKAPEAYAVDIENRYPPILDGFSNFDLNNLNDARQAAIELRKIIEESGVSISEEEALLIIKEISANPQKLQKSLANINRSFKVFSAGISQ